MSGSTPVRRPLVLIAGKDPVTRFGGHGTYVRAHALAAQSLGFDPHVFSFARRCGSRQTAFGTVHHVAAPLRDHHTAGAHCIHLGRAASRFLLDSGADGPHLIHSFSVWAGAGVHAARVLARHGVEAIPIASAYTTLVHEHRAMARGIGPHHTLKQRTSFRLRHAIVRTISGPMECRGYRSSRVVLVNYESVREILHADAGPGIDIRRIPYAPASAFDPEPLNANGEMPSGVGRLEPRDAPLIVMVSRHDPRKGHDVLLSALQAMAAAGVPFRACLVGPGRLLDDHRRLAAALGLCGRVEITGGVPDSLVYQRAADVFVLPSLEEGSGSVALLEALEAGTAVVASSCDGIPEDLGDGADALLVAPGDAQALAAALTRVVTDPELRKRLATRARAVFEARFSAAGLVSALGETYASFGVGPV